MKKREEQRGCGEGWGVVCADRGVGERMVDWLSMGRFHNLPLCFTSLGISRS